MIWILVNHFHTIIRAIPDSAGNSKIVGFCEFLVFNPVNELSDGKEKAAAQRVIFSGSDGARGCSTCNLRFAWRLFTMSLAGVHHHSRRCVDFEARTVAARYSGSYVRKPVPAT